MRFKRFFEDSFSEMSAGLLIVFVAILAVGCHSTSSDMMEEAAAQRSPFMGRMAPDFTLTDHRGWPITLSSFRGKWVVLYFYPKDDTPGCTCQATEFTKLLLDFRELNAEIIGVSADSPAAHRDFVSRYNLKITLLSDPEHEVMQNYGAWAETQFGENRYKRVIRTTFLIDPQGQIRYHWPEVLPQGHAKRVKLKLAEFQGVEG
jgi:peroxiredoxin Q/BCP